MSEKLTAKQLTEILRTHYLPAGRYPPGLFATEVQSPCGRRRADAVFMPTSTTSERGIIGHEIKVSRSDLISELMDPLKCEPWAQYCRRWWLVVSDPDMIAGLNLPSGWGVLAPPSGRLRVSMTVVRPAPDLEPRDPAPALRRLISWQMDQSIKETFKLNGQIRGQELTIRRLEQKLRDHDVSRALAGTESNFDSQVRKIVAAVKAAEDRLAEAGFWRDSFNEQDVIDALLDTAVARDRAASIRQAAMAVEQMLKLHWQPFDEARRATDRAAKLARKQIDRATDTPAPSDPT